MANITDAPGTDPNADTWPNEDLTTVDRCPYCGHTGRSVAHSALRDIVFRVAPGSFAMMQCDGCGAGYLDPRPSDESLGRAYARYYTHAEGPAEPTHGGSGLGAVKRALSNGYRNRRYGQTLRPAPALGDFIIRLMPGRRRRIDTYFRFLPREPGEVLDFGCGNGRFLALARSLGWRTVGADFDAAALAVARGHADEVRLGGIETLAGDHDRHDAATVAHVFEHVPTPNALAEALFRALKPGGTLFVETPNMQAACHRLFGPSWRGLEAPRHLNLPTWRAMSGLLARTGFIDIRRHPRRDVFPDLYRQSAALADGGDSESPERFRYPPPPAWKQALLTLDPSSTEFLTVTARKPGPESTIQPT